MLDRSAATTRAIARDGRRLRQLALAGSALVLAVLYARRALAGWTEGPLPYDLVVFLGAADAILDGRTPFPEAATLTGDQNYVYPPLLALALIPLSALPMSLAVLLWVVVGVAAVATSLRLLGVRDPWVYVVAFLYPATRDAIGAGTVGPLLLLAIALAWRFRDSRSGAAALSVGLAVALKLFTWPLLVWLAATRRVRTALLAVALGAGLALASWAMIGFDGLGSYGRVLRRLAELEAERSYSLVALARALGAGDALAVAVSVAAGVALLAYALLTGRDERFAREDRDRRALTAAIAAALALSPIVWIHYLLLLLAPLALVRPRLSPLWLVLLVPVVPRLWGWEPAGWPEGDLVSLALILGVAALALAPVLRVRST